MTFSVTVKTYHSVRVKCYAERCNLTVILSVILSNVALPNVPAPSLFVPNWSTCVPADRFQTR